METEHLKGPDLSREGDTFRITAEQEAAPQKNAKSRLILTLRDKTRQGLTWVTNNTNCECMERMYGSEFPPDWVGRLVTIAYDPNVKFGKDVVGGIRVIGSPELKKPLSFPFQENSRKQPHQVTLKPTGTTTAKPPATVDPTYEKVFALDPVTGEVGDDDIGFTDEAPHPEEAVSSTQRPQISDAVDEGGPYASAEEDAPDGDIPGRGALFAADDPNRSASNSDKKKLSEALAGLNPVTVKQYRKRFGGRGNSELTHGECDEFRAWAVKEALT